MNPERYPKGYKGPMAGISINSEWMDVRGIDAFRWIRDGTWTYSDFDCWFGARDTFHYKLGERHVLNALEEFQKITKLKSENE